MHAAWENNKKSQLSSALAGTWAELGQTNLACVFPVHGVDGGARVHVHEVVVVIARHHPPASIVELHGEAGVLHAHARGVDGVRVITTPPSYFEASPPEGDLCH